MFEKNIYKTKNVPYDIREKEIRALKLNNETEQIEQIQLNY